MNLTSEELKETLKEFSYDYSYWSVNSADVNYASQEQVCAYYEYVYSFFFK